MSAEAEGRHRADQFRVKHDLDSRPIEDIVALMELVDIDVLMVDAGSNEHGLTARDVETGTTVFVVNRNVPSVRFRSTLAHELAHHLFAEDLSSTDLHEYSSPSEQRAHAFARHLLLPLDAVKAAHRDHPEFTVEDLLNWCVRRHHVSPKLAAIQMLRAGMVDEPVRAEFAGRSTEDMAVRYGWVDEHRVRDRAARASRRPRRLQEMALRAYRDGRLPAVELAAITGLSLFDIHELIGPEPVANSLPEPEDLGDDDLSDLW